MEHYTLLSEIFSYPEQEHLPGTLPVIRQMVREKYPECNDKMETFFSYAGSNTLDEQREYYTRTFDVEASCYLDLGYVLFGDDYKRGEFLVNLRREHIKAGNDCGCELADHLPNMLKLLPKIKDKALADELAFSLMIPALQEILKNFKDDDNVYKSALELLLYIMKQDFNNPGYKQYNKPIIHE